jgi:ribosomal-protein-alanine N-acetyltransferase
MELRAFRSRDLATLAGIDQSCFPAGIAYSRPELKDFISQPNSRTWVAAEGETILGFLIAEQQASRAGHVITIDVVEAWRNRGVGTKLMEAAENWVSCLGLRLIYLETAEDNLTAQRFYGARGYEKVKAVAHYYSNGAAAWVMVKRLGASRTSSAPDR